MSGVSLPRSVARMVESAQALHQAGRVGDAEQAYAQIVRAIPQYADGWFLYGTAALQAGRHAEAVERLERAIALDRRSARYHFNAGLAYQGLARLDRAAEAFRKALRLDASLVEAHNSLGVVLQAQGKRAEAIAAFRRTVGLRAGYALGHYNLGTALKDDGKIAEAAASFRQAAQLEPAFTQAHANLGVMLQELGDKPGAEAAYTQALAQNPNEPESLNNLATLRRDSGDLAGAAALLSKAIAVRPTFAEAHRNKGLLHLSQGELAAGWPAYDWRWQCPDLASSRRPFQQPVWDGQPLAEGALLVWGEQGIGDEILYAGMMDDVARGGFPVVWEADVRLVPLLRRSCPALQVVARTPNPDPRADGARVQIAAGGLGRHFRARASDFPALGGYLRPDPARVAALREHLGLAPGESLIGLSWVSQNPVYGTHKSTRLVDWEPLLRTPAVRFVDLQYGDTLAQRGEAERLGLKLEHLEGLDLRDDLEGLAALIAICDLVVTVSNTTAHLAGALGRPVWVVVSAGGGKLWYWGHRDARTLWYPSATVFRQTVAGEWKAPVESVTQELQKFLQ